MPAHPLLATRFSPLRFDPQRTLTDDDVDLLLEAARWAPSAGNTHPWRILYAHRDTEHWPVFFGLLVERNQLWCRNAAALLVFISRTTNEQTGKPLRTHTYDTGAAWENVALQGTLRGLVVHGMAGFDYARAKSELVVPADFTVEAMAAIGKPGRIEDLPEDFQARESPSARRPVSELVFEGGFREV